MDILDDIEKMDQLNNQNKLRDCYIELADKLRKFANSLSSINKKITEKTRIYESIKNEPCEECKKEKLKEFYK